MAKTQTPTHTSGVADNQPEPLNHQLQTENQNLVTRRDLLKVALSALVCTPALPLFLNGTNSVFADAESARQSKLADLVASFTAVNIPNVQSAPSVAGTATLRLTNSGTKKVKVSVKVDFYLSLDTFQSPALDLRVISLDQVALNLKPGASTDVPVQLQIARDRILSDRQYYLLADVDSANAVPESTETNNRAVTAQPAILPAFPNGVASGDTTQTSTVLWARSLVRGEVTFVISTSADFSAAPREFKATVGDPTIPVKVTVDGLSPNTQYFFRATDAARNTAAGKLKTAAVGGTQAGFHMGVSGDWRGELSPYPSISNVADRNLDCFIQLGDTIYADYPSQAVTDSRGNRKPVAETLLDYRMKHSEGYTRRFGLNTWSAVRESTSILAVIDDHEVINDFAGGAKPASDPRFANQTGAFINETAMYQNGLRAFSDYHPIRSEVYQNTGDARLDGKPKLYRFRTYGSDAAIILLDSRSFRDEPLRPYDPSVPNNADAGRFILESFDVDPATLQPKATQRTLLGKQQLADLKADLLKAQNGGEGVSPVTWKFIVVPEPIQNLGLLFAEDRFEGYSRERSELLGFITAAGISNVVFLSADIHGTVINNLTFQTRPFGEQVPTTAFEITTGAVAFDAPFGPTVVEIAAGQGLIDPSTKAFYDSLPVANDTDSLPNDRDDFLKSLINEQVKPLGYPEVGLANTPIQATLLEGDYLATHVYGWSEFEIDAATQELTITTWGIAPYSEAELLANPASILARIPQVVSKFVVTPK